jgi:predicted PurR-regulated permease PerM
MNTKNFEAAVPKAPVVTSILTQDVTSNQAISQELPEPPPLSIPRAAVDARGTSLAILAALALLFALQWANKFFIPLLFGIFIAYTLNPLVVWLERIRIPRFMGTSLIIISILCGAGAAANTLHAEFQSILEKLPTATHKITRALAKAQKGRPSTMEQMQAAATEIEKATGQGSGVKSTAKASFPNQPAFKVSEFLWAGSLGAIGFISQATMVLFLVFFLLLSGDTFKRKLVKLTGPSLSQKKITVHILDDIHTSIQNYMFMLLVTNSLLALLMWVALRTIGLENAGAWAVAAGFMHIIPYFGPLLITVATGFTAFMQFESLSMALVVAGASLAIATLIGTFVTTWMTGKIAKMNAAAVFIGLLFWGWLWGVWGLLLGIPIIVVIKVIAEHVEGMQSFAELLAE